MRSRGETDSLEPLPVEVVSHDARVPRAGFAQEPPLPRRSPATFTRLTTLHPALLAGLPEWWRDRACDARVGVTRGLVVDPPECEGGGTWHMRGRLRSAWLRRPIPVELQMWPRLGSWTKVSLQPQRRVHLGRRYFRMGHRALDALTECLDSELPRS